MLEIKEGLYINPDDIAAITYIGDSTVTGYTLSLVYNVCIIKNDGSRIILPEHLTLEDVLEEIKNINAKLSLINGGDSIKEMINNHIKTDDDLTNKIEDICHDCVHDGEIGPDRACDVCEPNFNSFKSKFANSAEDSAKHSCNNCGKKDYCAIYIAFPNGLRKNTKCDSWESESEEHNCYTCEWGNNCVNKELKSEKKS